MKRALRSIQGLALLFILGAAVLGAAVPPVVEATPELRRTIVRAGASVTLSPLVTSEGAGTTYQWQRGGRPLPGATQASLVISNANARDQDWYELLVTNSAGTTASPVMFVIVAPAKPELVSLSPELEVDDPAADYILARASGVSGYGLKSDGAMVIRRYDYNGSTTTLPSPDLETTKNAVAFTVKTYGDLILGADTRLKPLTTDIDTSYVLDDVVEVHSNSGPDYALKRNGDLFQYGYSPSGWSPYLVAYVPVTNVATFDSSSTRLDVIFRDGRFKNLFAAPDYTAGSEIPNAVRVSSSLTRAFVLRADGTVVTSDAPTTIRATDVIDLGSSGFSTLGLKSDGTVVILEDPYAVNPLSGQLNLGRVTSLGGSWLLRDATSDLAPTITSGPASATRGEGQSITLTADVSAGTSILHYQWRKDGTAIEGAKGSYLKLEYIDKTDAGTYDVIVSTALGSTTSGGALLTVADGPTVTATSATLQAFSPGEAVDFSVTATGTGTLHHQWYFNAAPISGATGTALHLTGTTPRSAGAYSLVTTDDVGARTTLFFLRRGKAPTQLVLFGDYATDFETTKNFPHDAIHLGRGQNISLVPITANGSVSPFVFPLPQDYPEGWFKKPVYDTNGTLVHYNDGTVDTHGSIKPLIEHSLRQVIALAGNDYGLRAGLRADGTVISFTTDGNTPPTFPDFGQRVTAIAVARFYGLALLADGTVRSWGVGERGQEKIPQGLDHVVRIFASAYFAAAIKDSGEAVAWGEVVDPTVLNGALEYSDPTVLYEDGTVRNLDGKPAPAAIPGKPIISIGFRALLRETPLDTAPVITKQPVPVTTGAGLNAALTVEANAGTNVLHYQWRKDGNALYGQTEPNLNFRFLVSSDAGTYDCVIENDLGSVTTTPVALAVSQGPVVSATSDPNVLAKAGDPVTLSVTATGTGTLVYSWFKDNELIAGANGPTYTIAAAARADAGRYRVRITDDVGQALRLFGVTFVSGSTQLLKVTTPSWASIYTTLPKATVVTPMTALTDNVVAMAPAADVVLLDTGVVARLEGPKVLTPTTTTGIAALTDSQVALKADGTAVFIADGAPDPNAANRKWVKLTRRAGLTNTGEAFVLPGGTADETWTTWRAITDVYDITEDGTNSYHVIRTDGTVFSSKPGVDPEYIAGETRYRRVASDRSIRYYTERVDHSLWRSYKTYPEELTQLTQLEPAVAFWDYRTEGMGNEASYASIDSQGQAGGELGQIDGLKNVLDLHFNPAGWMILRDASGDLAPVITKQPQSRAYEDGNEIRLSVEIDARSVYSTYQWRKNGVAIEGATAAVYDQPASGIETVGDYDVVITNSLGTVTSDTAKLTRVTSLTVTPLTAVRQLVTAGQSFELAVSASNTTTSNVTYQWYLEGKPLPGSNGPRLKRDHMQAMDAGLYRVHVSDGVTSNGLLMRVAYQPLKALLTASQDLAPWVETPRELETAHAIASYMNFLAACGNGVNLSLPEGEAPSGTVMKFSINQFAGAAALMQDGTVQTLIPTAGMPPSWTPLEIGDAVDVMPQSNGWLVLKSDGDLVPLDETNRLPTLHRVQSAAGGGFYSSGILWTRWDGTVGAIYERATLDPKVAALTDAASLTSDGQWINSLGYYVFTYNFSGYIVRRDGSLMSIRDGSDWPTTVPVRRTLLLGGYNVALLENGSTVSAGYFLNDYDPHERERFLDAAGFGGNTLFLLDRTHEVVPVVTNAPQATRAAAGETVTLTAEVAGPDLTYQWYKDGKAIPGATAATLEISGIQNSDAGNYYVVATNAYGSTTSRAATVSVGAGNPSRLINLSVRGTTRSEAEPLIVGFVMQGGSKEVLLRAAGPSLATFEVAGALPDPMLTMHRQDAESDTIAGFNNDWQDGGQTALLQILFGHLGAFPFDSVASKDSALYTTADGARTVHVYPAPGTAAGVTLVEAYDAGVGPTPRFINVSARNEVGIGSEVLIAGFVISGDEPKKILVRGVGPRLAGAPFLVSSTLSNPELELHTTIHEGDTQRDVVLGYNDDWSTEPGAAAAFTAAGAFPLDANSKDAAIVTTLPAGAYTVVLRGVNDATGQGLVEVYELP